MWLIWFVSIGFILFDMHLNEICDPLSVEWIHWVYFINRFMCKSWKRLDLIHFVFPLHSSCSDLDLKGNHFSPLPLLCSDLDLVGDRFLPLHFPRKSTLFILIMFRPRWVDIWDLVKIILATKFCPFLDQNKVYEWYLVGCKKNNALARCLLVWIWCFCFSHENDLVHEIYFPQWMVTVKQMYASMCSSFYDQCLVKQ